MGNRLQGDHNWSFNFNSIVRNRFKADQIFPFLESVVSKWGLTSVVRKFQSPLVIRKNFCITSFTSQNQEKKCNFKILFIVLSIKTVSF